MDRSLSEADSSSAGREIEPEVSLPCLQKPATGPYLEPVESIPQRHIPFLQDPFYITPNLLPRLT
jgi:hypothetical protein